MAVASLPIYDVPELAEHTDRLWQAMARALRRHGFDDVPIRLDRRRHHREVWHDPDLLISQTCGYPLVNELDGLVRVVATPSYAVSECVGAWYTSRVLVRKDSPAHGLGEVAGMVCAANEIDSHSGMNGFRALLAPVAARRHGRLFSRVVWSGGHRSSLEMLAAGEADVTAVDSVSFALIDRVAPELTRNTREIARTAPCPGVPLITNASRSDEEVAAMRRALAEVFRDPDTRRDREALLIDDIEILPDAAYQTVHDLEALAQRLGYPELA